MRRLNKIKAVYQSTLGSQYEDTSAARVDQSTWLQAQPKGSNEAVPEEWSLLVSYWKHKFSKGYFCSMPSDLFERCAPDAEFDYEAARHPIATLVGTVNAGVPPCDFPGENHISSN